MHTHRPLLLFSILLLASIPSPSFAGGSFSLKQVQPLLQQDKDLNHFITSTLDLDSGGWATRIGSLVNEDLGGARIAPYSIRAKPKGSPGPWIFYLEIEADTTFLDAQGKPVPLEQGKTIQEKLTDIKLIPIPESDRK
jgi:hypothetical protein